MTDKEKKRANKLSFILMGCQFLKDLTPTE